MNPKALNRFLVKVLSQKKLGPVDQSGMIAAFARRKPRVQIPPGPLLDLTPFGYESDPTRTYSLNQNLKRKPEFKAFCEA